MNNVALQDADLEVVAGGFNVLSQMENIANSTFEGAKTGAKIGILGGPVFAFGGAGAGAFFGGISGVKDAVGQGMNEAIAGIKNIMA